ncbi:ATP-binding protein [Streptomyces sp. HNM0663]|uniref:ATP-binding protein n=1 Tax=Streptomyces chengmaiensis TaxID=3040919 RepID=A0ABT6HWL1_9ACTN|nr:ATP-binding protein [Streptomyces chengmaiensis]MDH2393087.1 ATP-binding protein [Streptomyces chengmaiensis]
MEGEEVRPAGGDVRLRRRLGSADLTAVPELRHSLRQALRRWTRSGTETADVAELLASELVTNALIHTDHGAVVTAAVAGSTLRVEVRDFVPGLPVPDVTAAPPRIADDEGDEGGEGDDCAEFEDLDELGTHGRGLILVERLADAWGVRTQAVGKVVWFELRRHESEGPA